MQTVATVTRDFLIRVAETTVADREDNAAIALLAYANELVQRGRYGDATEDEIEQFDMLLEAVQA